MAFLHGVTATVGLTHTHPQQHHMHQQVWEVIKPTVCGLIYPEICDAGFQILGACMHLCMYMCVRAFIR